MTGTVGSERARSPRPLLKRRLPSGRGATEQPNITSDGDKVLTPRFWVLVILTGVATGLLGDLMMLILFHVQYLAFGYHSGSLQQAVERATAGRRVGSLLIAGAFGGVAWYVLRRLTPGEHSEIDDALWNRDGRLSFRRSLGTSVISEAVIGMGASIGREAAPKLLGGASARALPGTCSGQPARRCVRAGRRRRHDRRGHAGPLAALVLVLELAGTGFGLMVPLAAATVTATAVAFYIDGYSIYSARLPSVRRSAPRT